MRLLVATATAAMSENFVASGKSASKRGLRVVLPLQVRHKI